MRTKILLIVGLVLVAFAAGYVLNNGEDLGTDKITSTTQENISESPKQSPTNARLSSLIRYQIPVGWEENACEGSSASYITRNGSPIDCTAKPVAPITLSIDESNSTDCNQLDDNNDVKKHTCISLYINDKKTLKTSTEYLESSSYQKAIVEDRYYFDSGSGVIVATYTHAPNDSKHQKEFDELVHSFTVK